MAVRQVPRLRDMFPRLFSGQDQDSPYSHWLKWEDYCNAYNLTPAQAVDDFKFSLCGDARDWIAGRNFQNPNELKKAFQLYFSGHISEDGSLEAFKSEKWNPPEPVEKFMTRLRRLAAAQNIGDRFVVDQFLTGIPPEMKTAIAMNGGRTIPEVVERAQRYVDLSRDLRKSRSVVVTDTFNMVQQRGHDDFRELAFSMREMAVSQNRIMSLLQDSYERNERRGRSPSWGRRQSYRNHSGDRFRDSRSTERRDRDTYRSSYRESDRYRGDKSQERRESFRGRNKDSRESFRRNSHSRERSDRDQSRGRSQERGKHFSQTSEQKPRVATPVGRRSDIQCQACKKPGHGWRECYTLANKYEKDFH